MHQFPKSGRAEEDVLSELRSRAEEDVDYAGGKTWSLVYHVDDAHKDFLARAHAQFASTNLLNPLAFKSLKKMETEVVSATAAILHGPESAVGTVTSGGTESILLAVKAAREMGKRSKPEIVVPETIHTAFIKAAHYFGMTVRRAKVDAQFRVRVDHIKKLTNRNTVLIAASAPQYAHGMIDPIEEIAAFAKKKKIPFHVDACFGGFILPWFEKLGVQLPKWDFRVPGVTSISADIHKFGYAAKGASVLVYRDMEHLKHQFFIDTEFPGGIYASPTILGTRPGGPIAAAWSVIQKLGEEGYVELAQTVLDTKKEFAAGIESIDGLKILGSEHGPIVTYGSDERAIDIYAVADLMMERGWSVDRQQRPACIHCTINANNRSSVPDYISDLNASVETVRKHPELRKQGEAAMYGMMAKIPVRGAVKMGVMKVLEAMHSNTPFDGVTSVEEDDRLMALMNKYGQPVVDVIDRVQNKLRR